MEGQAFLSCGSDSYTTPDLCLHCLKPCEQCSQRNCYRLHQKVGRAASTPALTNLLIIGASLARQCLEAGLIVEILVHVAPIWLGDGVRFFARKAGEQVALETIAVSQAEQLITLRFRVRKACTEATDGE